MNNQQVKQAILSYLPNVIHMSLGTSRDNKPWVCEVHFTFDDDMNLYFRSLPSRRHSQDIADNPQVAGNIVEQHDNTMKPRGMYFEGTAELLEGVAEDDIAYKLSQQRFGLGPEILEEAAKDDGHKFYKITVDNWYMFDARDSKPSQKYQLQRED